MCVGPGKLPDASQANEITVASPVSNRLFPFMAVSPKNDVYTPRYILHLIRKGEFRPRLRAWSKRQLRTWGGVRHHVRRLSCRWRSLPDFLLIGAQRSGTTSLFAYLTSHPQISPPLQKEVHYFDFHFAKSVCWYRAFFPIKTLRPPLRRDFDAFTTGEASPFYLFHPTAPSRAHSVVPDARIIVILRDPVRRAYSHFIQSRLKGLEPRESFEAAIEWELNSLDQHHDYDDPDAQIRFRSYLQRGLYAQQLRRWLELYPREQVHLIETERLKTSPEEVLQDLWRFLELSEIPVHGQKNLNARRYQPLEPAVEERLRQFYGPYNQELRRLIDEDMSWMQ